MSQHCFTNCTYPAVLIIIHHAPLKHWNQIGLSDVLIFFERFNAIDVQAVDVLNFRELNNRQEQGYFQPSDVQLVVFGAHLDIASDRACVHQAITNDAKIQNGRYDRVQRFPGVRQLRYAYWTIGWSFSLVLFFWSLGDTHEGTLEHL